MKACLSAAFFLSISISCLSQVKYKPGYYITNEGVKTSCLIRDLDWKNNPTEFTYKLDENSADQIATIKTVALFEILNASKYKRVKVDIDRSSSDLNKLSHVNTPEFSNEELFLKYLVEGKASLFYYEENNLIRFFYNVEGSNPQQLLYKQYYISDDRIGENKAYVQQLLNNVTCEKIATETIETIGYTRRDLVKHFINYNKCQKADFTDIEAKRKRDKFNLTLRVGISSTSLAVENDVSPQEKLSFDNKVSGRFGIETEYIMPFKNNKWAIIAEAAYQSYTGEQYFTTAFQKDTATINYKSVQIPIGIRHYFFLGNNSKLFLNALLVVDIPGNSTYKPLFANTIKINSRATPALGFGYKYNNKFSVELRYDLKRQLFLDQQRWDTDYKKISIIAGYSIF